MYNASYPAKIRYNGAGTCLVCVSKSVFDDFQKCNCAYVGKAAIRRNATGDIMEVLGPRVVKTAFSHYISIPKALAKHYDLKKGESVQVTLEW